MSRSHPPALAIRLLTRFVSSVHTDSLVGDLIEQHQRGRSTLWFWRQTLIAIVRSGADEVWRHPLMTIWIAGLSASLEQLWLRSRIWIWVVRVDNLWYPRLIHSRWSWMVINPWAYRLQLYSVTIRVAWCGLLALLSWILSRMYPRQRGLTTTLLLAPQVGFAPFYLSASVIAWLREPGNPMVFFGLFWFAAFELIAVPSSILLAGLCGQRRRETA